MNDLRPSVRTVCAARLDSVARATGLGDRSRELLDAFHSLTAGWGSAAARDLPASDVCPDGSPVEVAVDLDDENPAVQFAVEALAPGDPLADRFVPSATMFRFAPSIRSAQARKMMARLVGAHDASAAGWAAVADLLLPRRPVGEHVAMFGAEVRRSGPVRFKVWFYLDIAGELRALEHLAHGLERLQLSDAWPAVVRHMARGESVDVPFLFSLDLLDHGSARTKIYFRHYDTNAERLAAQLSRYPGFTPGAVSEFCRRMSGDAAHLGVQAPVTTLTFLPSATRGPIREPAATTLYMPLWTYAPNDVVIRDRVRELLAAHGSSPRRYEQALAGMAGRPIERSRGIHNYISWKPGRDRPRIKVYWSPELRAENPPARYMRRAGSHPAREPIYGTSRGNFTLGSKLPLPGT